MTTRMLIDARHSEETRVAVLQGKAIEEFDFESAEHKQIKGNIYLAKVTRVEPSLQAAFVDFGGNRHGFLAFSEIHPDYYQIPREDREALLAEEAAHAEEEEALRAEAEAEDEAHDAGDNGDDYGAEPSEEELDAAGGVTEIDTSEKDHVATIDGGHVENGFDAEFGDGDYHGADDQEADDRNAGDRGSDDRGARDDGAETDGEEDNHRRGGRGGRPQRGRSKEAEELRAKRMALRRRYKIQDVIHRRQVLLVQVVKEERGNKGAALTTYLSLAGRYCVLMPNSTHGGGISRKISSASDRKRLKGIIGELDLPKTMGCIVRTAGLSRTKAEIKRDFDYLARLWDEIRENTLRASAPEGIHSDSDLIKRAIRDIYNRDIEEVVVEGEEGYHAARDFMKLLMPSHARRVKAYSDPVPLFQRYGAEDQLTAMYDPVVQLRSGGYIVINPTEALVSIDINSGRSTKEYGIEATALNTNLEAAREIARQLRLRDMAGLVVIDFIDMEHGSSVRKVEKAMKDALRNDRARIQVGRISSFGLMEMSRQRLRTGVLEATTRHCPHCDGSGLVRTASSAGLAALRLIEDEAAKGRGSVISLFASTEATIYLLNAKRLDLGEIEDRYGVRVEVLPEGENEGAKMRVGSSGPRPEFAPRFAPIVEPEPDPEDDDPADEYDGDDVAGESGVAPEENDDGAGGQRRKRRRRRQTSRGGERREDPIPERVADDGSDTDGEREVEPETDASAGGEDGDDEREGPRKRRRRGRRRRGRARTDDEAEIAGEAGEDGEDGASLSDSDASAEPELPVAGLETPVEADAAEPESPPPAKRSRPRRAAAVEPAFAPSDPVEAEATEAPPKRTRRKPAATADAAASDAPVAEATLPDAPVPDAAVPDAPVPDATVPAPAKPRSRRKAKDTAADAEAQPAEPEAEQVPSDMAMDIPLAELVEPRAEAGAELAEARVSDDGVEQSSDGPPRRGWWQRTFGA